MNLGSAFEREYNKHTPPPPSLQLAPVQRLNDDLCVSLLLFFISSMEFAKLRRHLFTVYIFCSLFFAAFVNNIPVWEKTEFCKKVSQSLKLFHGRFSSNYFFIHLKILLASVKIVTNLKTVSESRIRNFVLASFSVNGVQYKSRHLSKIQNGRHKQRSGQHTLTCKKYTKKHVITGFRKYFQDHTRLPEQLLES
jgi:hypothetical protein